MTRAAAIHFTQDQMRTLTGVSAETVRHWRKIVPYLASKAGKAARFSFADLLGLTVTNELVNSLGVNISSMSVGIDALFKLLADASAPPMDGVTVFITSTTANFHDNSWSVTREPVVVVPLDPLVARLQQHVLPMMPIPAQGAFPFTTEIA